ncbi:MAG: hypothetical protein ACOYVG_08370 [Bacteroidota bacterium]
MKKVTAILFLFIFLCANTAFGELFKLPALIQHYHYHGADTSDKDHIMSFWEFVKKHYSDTSTRSGNTNHDHKNLPFKSVHCSMVNNRVVLPQYHNCQAPVLVFNLRVKKFAYTQQNYSSASLSSIWQPPRFS